MLLAPVVCSGGADSRSRLDMLDRRTFILVGALFVAALAARAGRLSDPILDFHPTRQYRSAIIARSFYYAHAPGVSEAQRARARNNAELQGAGEPPLLEWLAALGFRVAGQEALWIGRLLSALLWMAGGWPLYRLARETGSPHGALLALTIYLFAPFALVASTSFQPDPLMTACIVWSALASYRFVDGPRPGSRRDLLIAISTAALAALAKPFAAFFTISTFVVVLAARGGLRRLLSLPALGFAVGALAPAAVYYGHGVLVGALRAQLSGRFLPGLFGTAFFWHGWLAQMRAVVGYPGLLAALAGVIAARSRSARSLLLGLWIGYLAFAIVSNYHVATHDYYSLPLVPIVALSVGALVTRLAEAAGRRLPRSAIVAILVALGGTIIGTSVWHMRRGSLPRQLRLDVRKYERIGRLVNHDSRSITLDPYYAYPLIYHGDVTGPGWPSAADLTAAELSGAPAVPAALRFDQDYAPRTPHFFIITDLHSYRQQPDLQALLESRFPRFAEDYNFIIFDLRARR